MSYRRKHLPHRCYSCWTRRTMKPLRLYKNPRGPKCKCCGKRTMFLCKDRLTHVRGRKEACNCGGYEFKHRRGSKFCHENRNAEQHWSERADAR